MIIISPAAYQSMGGALPGGHRDENRAVLPFFYWSRSAVQADCEQIQFRTYVPGGCSCFAAEMSCSSLLERPRSRLLLILAGHRHTRYGPYRFSSAFPPAVVPTLSHAWPRSG